MTECAAGAVNALEPLAALNAILNTVSVLFLAWLARVYGDGAARHLNGHAAPRADD